MKGQDIKQRFVELRARGWSFDKIARELKVSKQTLIDWSKEMREEIATVKALELEALQESYSLLYEDRLRNMGNILTRLRDEIVNRNLSDISTEKLLELYLKYSNQVKEEITEPVFKTSREIEEEARDRALLEELTVIRGSHPVRKLKIG